MFQVGRMVYELMFINDTNAVYRILSMDRPYKFFTLIEIFSVANESHIAASTQELSFAVRDQIGITWQRKDGWSMGVSRKTHKMGLFPSHKVEQPLAVADFPTYKNIS